MDLHHNGCIVAVDEAVQRPSYSSALPCWDAVDSAASGMSCILCGGPAEIGKGVWLLETAICGPVTVWPRWFDADDHSEPYRWQYCVLGRVALV